MKQYNLRTRHANGTETNIILQFDRREVRLTDDAGRRLEALRRYSGSVASYAMARSNVTVELLEDFKTIASATLRDREVSSEEKPAASGGGLFGGHSSENPCSPTCPTCLGA